MKKRSQNIESDAKHSGFTLVEIIAVLTIIGILGSLAVGKVIALDNSAIQKSFELSARELNSREKLSWSRVKLTSAGWIDDLHVFGQTDHDLGPDYRWIYKSDSGGKLAFKGQEIILGRIPSTTTAPGNWMIY